MPIAVVYSDVCDRNYRSRAMSKRQGNAEKKAAAKSKKSGQKITRMKTKTREEVRQGTTMHKQSRQTGDRL
jgi:hypothetical protein